MHFALSVCYGLLQAPAVSRVGPMASVVVGAIFGAMLFMINMYGFTAIFPWFETSRDWITAIAHVSFGMAAAIVYKACERDAAARAQTRQDCKIDP